MFNSLRFYSLFHKEIQVSHKKKSDPVVQKVISQIDNNGSVDGVVFRPTPDIMMWMMIAMSVFFGVILFFMFWGVDIFSWFGDVWAVLAILFFAFFAFYYSFFMYLIGPLWVRKHIDQYFIYIGKEGIIRKDGNRVAFIPWDVITGVKHFDIVRGGGHHIDLHIKGHDIWCPKLVRGTDNTNMFQDWVDYDIRDQEAIEREIQRYL